MKLRILFTTLAVLILAASCTSGTEGIFASIEREQKIVSLGGLNKTASVTSMAELTAKGRYFITGGKTMFSRSTASGTTTWNSTSVADKPAVVAVGVAGSTAYAVASGTLYSSPDGGNWQPVALSAGDSAYDLVPIRTGDGVTTNELVVVTTTGGNFVNAYRLTNAGGLVGPIVLTNPTSASPIVAAIYDGTNYYAASESYLWNLTTLSGSLVTTGANLPVTGYTGLIYLNNVASVTGYFIATRSNGTTGGGLYFSSTISGAFSAIKTNAQTPAGKPVTFGNFLYNSPNHSLWVTTGPSTFTEGTGYAEVTLPNSYNLVPNTNTNNYNSSSLPTAVAATIFKASDGTYFLGTVAHGLWTWSGSGSSGVWSQQ